MSVMRKPPAAVTFEGTETGTSFLLQVKRHDAPTYAKKIDASGGAQGLGRLLWQSGPPPPPTCDMPLLRLVDSSRASGEHKQQNNQVVTTAWI